METSRPAAPAWESLPALPPLINPWERSRQWALRSPLLVAYHEVGHALVACHYGFPFAKVSLIGDWEKAGYIAGVAPPRSPAGAPSLAEGYVAYLLGGAAALKVVLGYEGFGWGATLTDQARAERWLRRVFADPAQRVACRAGARRQAHVIATCHLPAIERLGQVLLDRKELPSGEFRRLLYSARQSAAVAQQVPAIEMNWSFPCGKPVSK